MPNATSAANPPIVSRDRVIDALRTILRTATQGEDKRFTVEQLAKDSGVSVRAIRSYMSNDPAEVREAPMSAALSLCVVVGGAAVNAFLSVIGYVAQPVDEDEAEGPALIAALVMGEVARFARCAADDRIDHVEEPISTEAADNTIQLLAPYSSLARAA